jgi:hypothetical protein
MACPQWTKSKNQPIDVFDILSLLKQCMGNPKTYGQKIEIGGDQVMSYMDLLRMTSKQMNKKRWIFSIPFFTVGLSKWWVSIFTGTNIDFVSPLVESLKHRMTPNTDSNHLYKIQFTPIERSIKRALNDKPPSLPSFHYPNTEKNTVRSVQRIFNPKKQNAQWVAKYYPIWLSKKFAGIINSKFDGSFLSFFLLGINLLELKLIEDRSTPNRQLFYITGGVLTKRKDLGWLEFRSILKNEYIITAIHEYVPKLPWLIYKLTQAKMHLYVMKRFERELQRLK